MEWRICITPFKKFIEEKINMIPAAVLLATLVVSLTCAFCSLFIRKLKCATQQKHHSSTVAGYIKITTE